MNIHDLRVGDKLKVLVPKNIYEDNTLNDIIEITDITPESNTLWISHIPDSFSGGGFRIGNENSSHCYKLGKNVEFVGNIKKEGYEYLITLFKKLGIK